MHQNTLSGNTRALESTRKAENTRQLLCAAGGFRFGETFQTEQNPTGKYQVSQEFYPDLSPLTCPCRKLQPTLTARAFSPASSNEMNSMDRCAVLYKRTHARFQR